MKIAYLILAHTDAPQLGRLVRALAGPDNGIFVHVDKKVDEAPFRQACDGTEQVRFVKNRVKVYWGGVSLWLAQTETIREALASKVRYDRFVLLTGTDYPLWSNKRIGEELDANPDREYIRCYNLSKVTSPRKVPQRVTTYHFRDIPINSSRWRHYVIGGLMQLMNRCPIRKRQYIETDSGRMDVYGGTQWWILTRQCVKYVIDTIDKDRHILKYFKTAFGPEELIVHTVVMHSPYAEHAVSTEDGVYPGLQGAALTHYIIYNAQGQHIFTDCDYDTLIASDRMFCRKVISGASDELVRLIDERRRQTTG